VYVSYNETEEIAASIFRVTVWFRWTLRQTPEDRTILRNVEKWFILYSICTQKATVWVSLDLRTWKYTLYILLVLFVRQFRQRIGSGTKGKRFLVCYFWICYFLICYFLICYFLICYVLIFYFLICYFLIFYFLISYFLICYFLICYFLICYFLICYFLICYFLIC